MLSQVGKYQIVEKIGVGGFGSVFKGRDPFIKRLVAIKTCQSDEEEIKKRFFREAEFAGNLHHRNITTIYDFGVTEEGTPYIVQEFLTGEDLDKKVKSKDPMPLARKVRILLDICDGLGYAHAQGIVHRDIKPSNIRILEDGTVKIMDFGIAKSMVSASTLTQTGITLGTASYLAPEQIRGEDVDPRTDIFSLGVLAYELLLFVKPFTGDHISTVLYKILNEQPPSPHQADPEIPEELSAIVMRSISKNREERQATCGELRSDLIAASAFLPEDVPGMLRSTPISTSPDEEKTMATPTGGLATMGGAVRPQTRSLAETPVRSASFAGASAGAGPLANVKISREETHAAAESSGPEGEGGGGALKLFVLSLLFVLLVGAGVGWLFFKGNLPWKPHGLDTTTPTTASTAAPVPPDTATVTAPTASTAAPAPTAVPTAPPAPTPIPPPREGYAVVKSNYHAELLVDGKRIAGGVETPRNISLKAGRHSFVFSTAGVPDVSKTVEIRPGEKSEVTAEFPPRGQLKIQIGYEAREASIYLDDRPIGRAPITKIVKAGSHKLVAILPGYENWVQQVEVPEQDLATVNIGMKKSPAPATP